MSESSKQSPETAVPEQVPDSQLRPTGAGSKFDPRNLDRVLVHSVAWTTTAKWLSQLLTWGITLGVARLLAPSDYGLIGMALLQIEILTLFSEFGLGSAIVTLKELTDEQISQLNSLSLVMGVVGFGLSAAVALPVGIFFRSPNLPAVVTVMSLGFLISSFRIVPYALLQREMKFKLLAIIEGLQGITQVLVTLVFALLGFGYWALVFGILAFSLTPTVLTLIRKRQRFEWPSIATLRRPLLFSWHLIVTRLSWYIYDSSDLLIAGRVLGQAPLGAYSLARTLAHSPLDKLTTLVNRVTPSIFATIQSDFSALRRYLRTITEGLSLVIFPVTLGMAMVAHDFVQLVLGSKWSGVILPLELHALHALLRSNAILQSPVLTAIRETRFAMWNSLATMVILPMSFYVASRWGAAGIAAVWVIVWPCTQIPVSWRLFRKINMTLSEYVAALWPALSGCILMSIAVQGAKQLLSARWPLYFRFAVEILAGGLVYGAALILLHRERLNRFLALVKSFRAQARPARP